MKNTHGELVTYDVVLSLEKPRHCFARAAVNQGAVT